MGFFLNSPVTETIKRYTYIVFPYPSPCRLTLTHNVSVSCNKFVILFAGIPKVPLKSELELTESPDTVKKEKELKKCTGIL